MWFQKNFCPEQVSHRIKRIRGAISFQSSGGTLWTKAVGKRRTWFYLKKRWNGFPEEELLAIRSFMSVNAERSMSILLLLSVGDVGIEIWISTVFDVIMILHYKYRIEPCPRHEKMALYLVRKAWSEIYDVTAVWPHIIEKIFLQGLR